MFERPKHFLYHKFPIVRYLGIFRPQLSLFEAVALIISGTIGAGVLGIPYAVAQAGAGIGMFYIVAIGLLMIGLNLMLGEVTIRTSQAFQLSGLAKKYLGRWGQVIMTGIVYASLFGILVVYIIGQGETLSALFGGDAFWWSVVFFVFGALLISIGLRTIKTVEMVLTLAILAVVLLIAAWSSPYVEVNHWQSHNLAQLLLPYGVVLFAFKGSTVIPEAHAILTKRDVLFKKAIILSGAITIGIYVLFSMMVVGVTGPETTQVATIGLGEAIGPKMRVLGNVFAVIAMATSFLVVGLSLRDSLSWDYNVRKSVATGLVLGVPMLIFLLGIREFVAVIDFVGGVFASLEMLLVILIYWRAKNLGDVAPSKYKLHHTLLLAAVLVLILTIGAVYSVMKLF